MIRAVGRAVAAFGVGMLTVWIVDTVVEWLI